MQHPPRDIVRRACKCWDAVERIVLAGLASAMVVVAVAQIVLRNMFRTGLVWAEPFLGMLLLWLTMFGALAATGARRHININIAEHFFPARFASFFLWVTNIFAAFVCGSLSIAGYRFCVIQREIDPTKLLGAPTWIYYLVIPLCLALMACRFALQSAAGWSHSRGAKGRESPTAPLPGGGA